jgi:ABC-2 type transport system ATP-binding protein
VEYSAWAHGVPGTDVHDAGIAALRAVDLLNLSTRRARTLSGGQRQRLGIACATVHRPDLLLLDEPTVGVDPLQRTTLRDMIAALGRRSTVLLSTHLVEDVARLADHVMIMHGGRLAYSGDTDDLVRTVPEAEDRAEAIETAFKAMAA